VANVTRKRPAGRHPSSNEEGVRGKSHVRFKVNGELRRPPHGFWTVIVLLLVVLLHEHGDFWIHWA
jgi:hypothetical protein